jgi:5-methylcytosine-specific restriction enzyme A
VQFQQIFYLSPEWRAFRRRYLALHPQCGTCGQPATQVDHIVARAKGGASFDEANCSPQCAGCHSRKTALYDGGFGHKPSAKGADINGLPTSADHPWNKR